MKFLREVQSWKLTHQLIFFQGGNRSLILNLHLSGVEEPQSHCGGEVALSPHSFLFQSAHGRIPMLEGKQSSADLTTCYMQAWASGWHYPNNLFRLEGAHWITQPLESPGQEIHLHGNFIHSSAWPVGKRLWVPVVGHRLCTARVIL